MKRIIIYYSVLVIIVVSSILSCSEELEYRQPSGTSPGIPAPIEEVTVTNYPGKATLRYNLPNDPSILYIKASYTITNGRSLEVKASSYVDSLVVEGFSAEKDYKVEITTVNRQEEESNPITITVHPTEAPIYDVRRSLDVFNAFGGYKLTAENKNEESIGILVMEKNEFGEWDVNNNFSVYTSAEEISSTIAGLDTIARNFAIVIRDRWYNYTDTLFKKITPIYETEIDRSLFNHTPLPGDAPMVSNGGTVRGLWDNRFGWPVLFSSLDAEWTGVPAVVTIDMGFDAKISKVWLRPFQEISGLFYDYCTPKHFEIWGSDNPNPNGEMDATWYKFGTYELKKPSGSPGKTETPSDVEAAQNGFFFEADLKAPRARYLRLVCLENWAGFGTIALDEMRVYGDPR